MTDADSVIAGQLHQSFVCAANTVRTRSDVRECENKRREKEPALGCPCGCVTRLWMLAGVGERERRRETERERAGFRKLCRESGWEFWESAG